MPSIYSSAKRFMHHLPLMWVQGLFMTALTLASDCHESANDTILASPDWVSPCGSSKTGSTLGCCGLQAGLVCLSNSICNIPGSNIYMFSDCTDINYSAPECPLYCHNRSDINEHRIKWNDQDQIWQCCSTNADGQADCEHPTQENFSAPAPSALSTIYAPSLSHRLSSSKSPEAKASSLPAQSTLNSHGFEATNSASPHTTTATSSISASTASSSSAVEKSGGGGSARSDNIQIGIGVGLGVPSAVGTIAGAYFAYLAIRRRRMAETRESDVSDEAGMESRT